MKTITQNHKIDQQKLSFGELLERFAAEVDQ
jgi:hypothetical protein